MKGREHCLDGFYRQYMYHPLLICDGDTEHLITAVLRRLVPAMRPRWSDMSMELRADSGFAVPALYAFCEAQGIDYTIGLIPNARLEALAEPPEQLHDWYVHRGEMEGYCAWRLSQDADGTDTQAATPLAADQEDV